MDVKHLFATTGTPETRCDSSKDYSRVTCRWFSPTQPTSEKTTSFVDCVPCPSCIWNPHQADKAHSSSSLYKFPLVWTLVHFRQWGGRVGGRWCTCVPNCQLFVVYLLLFVVFVVFVLACECCSQQISLIPRALLIYISINMFLP